MMWQTALNIYCAVWVRKCGPDVRKRN